MHQEVSITSLYGGQEFTLTVDAENVMKQAGASAVVEAALNSYGAHVFAGYVRKAQKEGGKTPVFEEAKFIAWLTSDGRQGKPSKEDIENSKKAAEKFAKLLLLPVDERAEAEAAQYEKIAQAMSAAKPGFVLPEYDPETAYNEPDFWTGQFRRWRLHKISIDL